MRDGSLAMGATPSETIKKCADPAALPGIVAGRDAGDQPRHRRNHDRRHGGGRRGQPVGNPLRQHDDRHLPDRPVADRRPGIRQPKTLSAFALGLVLFVVTLVLNIVALRVVKRFREAYD
jgi:phosphate transport system permease protein